MNGCIAEQGCAGDTPPTCAATTPSSARVRNHDHSAWVTDRAAPGARPQGRAAPGGRAPRRLTAALAGRGAHRSVAARLPDDLPTPLALAVLDVCGAPALTARVVRAYAERGHAPSVAVLGGAGKSGSLALAAARRAGASRVIGVVPTPAEGAAVELSGLADAVVQADARDPIGLAAAVGAPVDVTVVCVDVPGCEHSGLLATAPGRTVV